MDALTKALLQIEPLIGKIVNENIDTISARVTDALIKDERQKPSYRLAIGVQLVPIGGTFDVRVKVPVAQRDTYTADCAVSADEKTPEQTGIADENKGE